MKVRYTPDAAAELAAVLDYIAERSPQGARNVHARIRAAESLLSRFPEIGQRGPMAWLRRIAVLPYPYLIFYEVRETEVWILRIRHGSRNPDDD